MTIECVIDTTPLLVANNNSQIHTYGIPIDNMRTRLQKMNATLREYKQKVHADKIRILDTYFRSINCTTSTQGVCTITPEFLDIDQINHFISKVNKELYKYHPGLLIYSSNYLREKVKLYNYDNIFAVKDSKYGFLAYLHWRDECSAFGLYDENIDAAECESRAFVMMFLTMLFCIIFAYVFGIIIFITFVIIVGLILFIIILFKIFIIRDFLKNKSKIEKYRTLLKDDIFEYKRMLLDQYQNCV